MKKLLTKKVLVSLLGMASAAVAVGLFPAGTGIVVAKIIAVIAGTFNIGQGIADGWSGGITSSNTPS